MSQKGEFSLSSVNALWHSTDAESPTGAADAAISPSEPGRVALGVAAYGLWGIFL